MAGLLPGMFSSNVRKIVRTHCQKCSIFKNWKDSGSLVSRTECFRTPVSLLHYQRVLTKCSVVVIIVMNKNDDCGMNVEIALSPEGRSENKFLLRFKFVSTEATPIMFIIRETGRRAIIVRFQG